MIALKALAAAAIGIVSLKAVRGQDLNDNIPSGAYLASWHEVTTGCTGQPPRALWDNDYWVIVPVEQIEDLGDAGICGGGSINIRSATNPTFAIRAKVYDLCKHCQMGLNQRAWDDLGRPRNVVWHR